MHYYSKLPHENREIPRPIACTISKIEVDSPIVFSLLEVEFDVDRGPVLKNRPEEMSDETETAFAFSALPDIRSNEVKQESFIFKFDKKICHVSFIQELDSNKPRGCIQKSIVIECNQYIYNLPFFISKKLNSSTAYSAESLLEHLLEFDVVSLKESVKVCIETIPPEIISLITKHKNIIIENLLRGKSFLVLGKSPTVVSSIVCYLSIFCGIVYGGEVLPYRTSFIKPEVFSKSVIIGGTNEYAYKKDLFDNVIDSNLEKFYSKEKECTDDLEHLFKLFEEFFFQSPEGFREEKWLSYLRDSAVSAKTRKIFREFFKNKNFTAWLTMHHYTIQTEEQK